MMRSRKKRTRRLPLKVKYSQPTSSGERWALQTTDTPSSRQTKRLPRRKQRPPLPRNRRSPRRRAAKTKKNPKRSSTRRPVVPKMKMMLRSLATERRRRQRPTLRTPLRPLGRKRRRQLQARGMKSKGKSWQRTSLPTMYCALSLFLLAVVGSLTRRIGWGRTPVQGTFLSCHPPWMVVSCSFPGLKYTVPLISYLNYLV